MRDRRELRLKNYAYASNGYYFITAVTKLRRNFFSGKEALILNELRSAIAQISGAKLDYTVVMPNHVHFIIILEGCSSHVGEIVRRFKAKVSHALHGGVWQANYYEHVIRNDKALYNIREYIQNNPEQLLLKFKEFYKN